MLTRSARRRLTAATAALALVATACGDDAADPEETIDEQPDDEAEDTDGEAEGADDEAPAALPDPVEGLSVVFEGEEYVGTGVRCEEDEVGGGLIQVHMIEVEVVAPDGREGAFRAMWDRDADHMHRVVLTLQPDPDVFEYVTYNVDWREDEVVGDIDFEAEVGASGELELKADSELSQEERPEGGTVTFDVDCTA